IALLAIAAAGFGQTFNISSQGTASTCTGTLALGTCTNGQTYTFTLCSNDIANGNSHISVSLNTYTISGGNFCVYDGDNAGAPLIGCNTDFSAPWAITATPSNQTGCLTFVYTAGAGDALNATIHCNFQCQDVQAAMQSTNPAAVLENGAYYIDICQGTQINFVGTGVYQNTTYAQSDPTSTFEWTFSSGTILNGQSVNWTPPAGDGYTVSLEITDAENCNSTNSLVYRIRVSRTPDFSGTDLTPDIICQGDTVSLIGMIESDQWSSQPPTTLCDTTYLPDGSGASYTTSITVAGFDPGQTLTNILDLLGICVNMEHSYLGDLEIFIECPSGQVVQLEDQGGGGTYLGVPLDYDPSPPGTGWDYCWTNNPTYGTMAAEGNNYSTLPSGSYTSYQSLSGLVGCELNGDWTITVIDNWSIDDGYIFCWWVDFEPSLYPSMWVYENTYPNHLWTANTGNGGQVFSGASQNGTGTYVTGLTTTTTQTFTYTVTDDFGCSYDTTITVTVLGSNDPLCCVYPVSTFTAQPICAGDPSQVVFTGTAGPGATFNWNFNGATVLSGSGPGPYQITWYTAGTYTVSLEITENGCTSTTTDVVVTVMPLGSTYCCMNPEPSAGTDGTICGLDYELQGLASWGTAEWSQSSGPGTSTFESVNNDTTIVHVSAPGTYTFEFEEINGVQCDSSDFVTVTFIQIPIANAGGDIQVCGTLGTLNAGVPTVGNGTWTANPSGGVTFGNPNNSSTTVTVPSFGGAVQYTFTWTVNNNGCTDADDVLIKFYQVPVPDAGDDFTSCGNIAELDAVQTSLPGYWTGPVGTNYNPNMQDATPLVTILPYTGNSVTHYFTWHEFNGDCTGSDSVAVTFVVLPNAEGGDNHFVCENTVTMNADTIGGYYSAATWSA
ncbi:MAG: hypothetical protein ABIJ16_11095, partial [Bacteroidota bacterium]